MRGIINILTKNIGAFRVQTELALSDDPLSFVQMTKKILMNEFFKIILHKRSIFVFSFSLSYEKPPHHAKVWEQEGVLAHHDACIRGPVLPAILECAYYRRDLCSKPTGLIAVSGWALSSEAGSDRPIGNHLYLGYNILGQLFWGIIFWGNHSGV